MISALNILRNKHQGQGKNLLNMINSFTYFEKSSFLLPLNYAYDISQYQS